MTSVTSEAAKTLRFRASAEPATTPFLRVEDNATVRFSRPYERVEIDSEPDPISVEIDLASVQPIEDTLPFALDDVPSFARARESEPYAMVEVALTVPAVAEPWITPEEPPLPRTNPKVVVVVAAVMIAAFACGMGIVLAVSS
jgi:hypothetical protein